jgi:hypothetical protein
MLDCRCCRRRPLEHPLTACSFEVEFPDFNVRTNQMTLRLDVVARDPFPTGFLIE